jgi:hypothetical protein
VHAPADGYALLLAHTAKAIKATLKRNGLAGSAPRSGPAGRRFKSCRSDQHLAEIPTSTGTDCGTVSSDAHATLAAFELLGCYSCG